MLCYNILIIVLFGRPIIKPSHSRMAPHFLAGTVLAAFVAQAPATAAEKAHEHGVGDLNLAIDGATVEIELEAPGADIVGFEHEPRNAAEKAAVVQAAKSLAAGAALFRFSEAAGCRLQDADVETPLLDGKHAHKEGEAEEHAGFHAHYRFICRDSGALGHLDTTYFEVFPNAAALRAKTITPSGQGAQRLTPTVTRLNF